MTKFYLIRHGEKEPVMGNPPLSKTGVRQAETAAKFLKQKNIGAVYAGMLLRTLQTAQIIGKVLNLPVTIDERLNERMNWGDKKDQTYAEFMLEWDKTSKDRLYQSSHGDSSFNTGRRLENFLLEMENNHKDKEVLVVTSGGTIGDFLQNTFDNLKLKSSPTGATYIEIKDCSITKIELENNKFILGEVGGITHLLPVKST